MCGGTHSLTWQALPANGLSPRVRGNRHILGVPPARPGSIPACAGEPVCGGQFLACSEVYPRVCGGTPRRRVMWTGWHGLSPRVRGNLNISPVATPAWGSIPACAGEPTSRRIADAGRGVYPRVCGGTRPAYGYSPADRGLSPRVRGNRQEMVKPVAMVGSIPACAGEPATRPGV